MYTEGWVSWGLSHEDVYGNPRRLPSETLYVDIGCGFIQETLFFSWSEEDTTT